MLESPIEENNRIYANSKGILFYKFTSPARRSVPDRMLVYPHGLIIFIEYKATGKKATELQVREHEKLRKNRQLVFVVDSIEQGRFIIDTYLLADYEE